MFLFAASIVFCGWMNPWYAVILLLSIGLNYLLARHMDKGKIIFYISLIMNIGLLLFLKYYNFFIGTINDVFKTDLVFMKLILPLGISFYTFSQIGFIYDVYHKKFEECSFLEYALYVSYFPKLIEGPITLHNDLIPQFRDENKKNADFKNISTGAYRFVLGLTKKVLLADTFALISQGGYSAVSYMNGLSGIVTVIAYSLQIYFDFSGYCDMAIGMSKMLNIDLIENFNSPYKAESISDFWDRWHISLTKFFTRYLYIPLGGSRRGRLRTYVNVMIVFLVSGLWHGANYTFILWGALYGILMIFERVLRDNSISIKFPRIVKISVTFVVVSVLWSLFGADSFITFEKLWRGIFSGYFLEGGINSSIILGVEKLAEYSIFNVIIPKGIIGGFEGGFVLFMEFIGLLIAFFFPNAKEKTDRFKPDIVHGMIFVLLLVYCIFSLGNVTTFIYSNF